MAVTDDRRYDTDMSHWFTYKTQSIVFRELRVSSMEKQLNEVTSVRVRNRVYFTASPHAHDFYSFLFVIEREDEKEQGIERDKEKERTNIYLFRDQLHRLIISGLSSNFSSVDIRKRDRAADFQLAFRAVNGNPRSHSTR